MHISLTFPSFLPNVLFLFQALSRMPQQSAVDQRQCARGMETQTPVAAAGPALGELRRPKNSLFHNAPMGTAFKGCYEIFSLNFQNIQFITEKWPHCNCWPGTREVSIVLFWFGELIHWLLVCSSLVSQHPWDPSAKANGNLSLPSSRWMPF